MRFSTELSDRRAASHRALQNRLRALFFSLGVVFVGFVLARDPKNWFWLAPPENPNTPQTAEQAAERAAEKPRPQPDDSPLRPGEIRIPVPAPDALTQRTNPAEKDTPDTSTSAVETGQPETGQPETGQPKADQPSGGGTDPQNAGSTMQSPSPTAAELRALIGAVNDNTVGLRASEATAYWTILRGIHDLSIAPKPAETLTRVTFAELDTDPADYRGRWLNFAGEFRRINLLEAPATVRIVTTNTVTANTGTANTGTANSDATNGSAVTDSAVTDSAVTDSATRSQLEPAAMPLPVLYEGWFFTDDAGPRNPYRVVFTRLPEGIATGDSVRVAARVTGLFFKRQSYQTMHGLHSAPLLLTREPEVIAQPKSTRKQRDQSRSNLTYLFAVAGVIVAMVVYNLARWNLAPSHAIVAATLTNPSDLNQLANAASDSPAGIHPPETSGNTNG